ncbi:hypothetical protein [Clostridium sp. JN-1]|uniref:hypothetical protein n=1 Tax=Clostridium sp. JN-1 TaxID=2483110 RepID=UPI000F0BC87B|nr:hypothetical protein [Clostridium sp. JN-1]
MFCLTRYDMRFGDIFIPARTKCTVINKIVDDIVDAPGIQVKMSVDNYDIKRHYKENENKVIKYNQNLNDASLYGFVIDTNTEAVYMDAGANIYFHAGVYDWQLEKIFGKENLPKNLIIGKYEYNGKDAKLRTVIEYLEDEFSEWVQNNCEFYALDEDDIENGEGFDGAQPGDKILSSFGLQQFYIKKLEYQNKLETIGFTYDFKGGLIWD